MNEARLFVRNSKEQQGLLFSTLSASERLSDAPNIFIRWFPPELCRVFPAVTPLTPAEGLTTSAQSC